MAGPKTLYKSVKKDEEPSMIDTTVRAFKAKGPKHYATYFTSYALSMVKWINAGNPLKIRGVVSKIRILIDQGIKESRISKLEDVYLALFKALAGIQYALD
jgi:hypothetical protein